MNLKDQVGLGGMTSIEIDAILDELELKLSKELESQSAIEQARLDIRKKIAQLRLDMLDLDRASEQAGHVISQTKIDIKKTESKKYRKLREEKFTT